MSDKYAAADELFLNAQEIASQLRHLAENEIDSDSFAVVTENYNGRETEFERPITDLAIDAAVMVESLLAEHEADKARIAHQREVMRQAADDISYAIFNLTGADLSRLKPGLVETTDPTGTALIAERNLRAAASITLETGV